MQERVEYIPQEVADEHTLVAQRYAGYFLGHPYRAGQQLPRVITVDKERPWTEPSVVPDGCIFCERLTDEEAVRRVAGYQSQLDTEVLRSKTLHYLAWLSGNKEEWIDTRQGPTGERVGSETAANKRRFIELRQDVVTGKRPDGWQTRPLPLIDLPLRLKRKLCIEWNHVYTRWMGREPITYDFEERAFYKEVADDLEAIGEPAI